MPSLVVEREILPTKLLAKTWHLTSVEEAPGKTGIRFDPSLQARAFPVTNPSPVTVTIQDDKEDVAEGLTLNILGDDKYRYTILLFSTTWSALAILTSTREACLAGGVTQITCDEEMISMSALTSPKKHALFVSTKPFPTTVTARPPCTGPQLGIVDSI
jgi:hypothetical protein